jgi:hypothetical protein
MQNTSSRSPLPYFLKEENYKLLPKTYGWSLACAWRPTRVQGRWVWLDAYWVRSDGGKVLAERVPMSQDDYDARQY